MKRLLSFVRRRGLSAVGGRVGEEIYSKLGSQAKYRHYIKKYEGRGENGKLPCTPLISIVSLSPEEEVDYDNYEVVEDVTKAKGDYVVFVPSGYVLSKNSLYEVAKKINEEDFDFIYGDEDSIEDGKRCRPFFKPDYSPDTLEAFWYTGGVSVFKKSILPCGNYGYDFVRQAVSKANKVAHIPKIISHNKGDVVLEKNTRSRQTTRGLVSIIIPSKDNPSLLKACISTVTESIEDVDFEIVVVDNGSGDENRKRYTSIINDCGSAVRTKYIYQKSDFNFSRMCNTGAKNAEGDYLLFLNDDITADNKNWLKYMLSKASEEHCGAVGIKLLYPDKRIIQHCGVALFPTGPVHLLQGLSDDNDYAFGRNRFTYNCIAVTAAAMMVSKEKFDAVGGFDEELSVAYNDVELCLKLYEKGWYNVNIAETYLIHHESATRGNDLLSEEKRKRLDRERDILYNKHFAAENTDYDVFYPKACSQRTVDFDIRY